MTNYMCATLGEGLRTLLDFIAEQEKPIHVGEIDEDLWDHLNGSMAQVSEQVYHLLVHMTEEESYDLITTNYEVKGNGLEAWRKLAKRWDPAVAGRSRKLLRSITNPKRSNMKNCLRAIQAWKALVSRYEKRRDANGALRTLAEDIKLSFPLLRSCCQRN